MLTSKCSNKLFRPCVAGDYSCPLPSQDAYLWGGRERERKWKEPVNSLKGHCHACFYWWRFYMLVSLLWWQKIMFCLYFNCWTATSLSDYCSVSQLFFYIFIFLRGSCTVFTQYSFHHPWVAIRNTRYHLSWNLMKIFAIVCKRMYKKNVLMFIFPLHRNWASLVCFLVVFQDGTQMGHNVFCIHSPCTD